MYVGLLSLISRGPIPGLYCWHLCRYSGKLPTGILSGRVHQLLSVEHFFCFVPGTKRPGGEQLLGLCYTYVLCICIQRTQLSALSSAAQYHSMHGHRQYNTIQQIHNSGIAHKQI